MSFLGKLATLFVEVRAQGVDVVNRAVEGVGGSLSAAALKAGEAGAAAEGALRGAGSANGLSAAVERVNAGLDALGKKAEKAGEGFGGVWDAGAGAPVPEPPTPAPTAPAVQPAAVKDAGMTAATEKAAAAVTKTAGESRKLGVDASAAMDRAARAAGPLDRALTGIFGRLTAAAAKAREAGAAVTGALTGAAGEGLSGRMSALTGFMGKLQKEAYWTGRGMGEMFQGGARSAVALEQALSPVVGRLSALTFAGINASWAGQMFQWQYAEISRQLASLFVPQITYVIDRLAALIRWLQSLDGEQQKQLRNWGLFAGGITLAATVLPRVIASVQALGVALQGVRAVWTALTVTNPFLLALAAIAAVVLATSDWKDIMEAVMGIARNVADPFQDLVTVLKDLRDTIAELREGVTGKKAQEKDEKGRKDAGYWLTPLGTSSREMKDELKPLTGQLRKGGWDRTANAAEFAGSQALSAGGASWLGGALKSAIRFNIDSMKLGENLVATEKRRELPPALGGIEGVEQTYNRIQMSSRMVGSAAVEKTTEEQALEELRDISMTVKAWKGEDSNRRPPITR